MLVHPASVKGEALHLVAAGLNDCEIARRIGVPRSTVRDWRRPSYTPRGPNLLCPRCWGPARPMWFSDSDYAELLGLYLGDGHIVRAGRTHRLRLFLDSSYTGIIEDARALLDRCFADNDVGVGRSSEGTTTILSVYCSHLTCLFPQHGAGKKHERPIALEEWQVACVEGAPMNFVRGCIVSDGCFFINRTGPYGYPSYTFRNFSEDIRSLFAWACELVGVEYRTEATSVRIYQRESVVRLTRPVGAKTY